MSTYEGAPRVQATRTACAGASAAYVMLHLAAKASYYVGDQQAAIIRDLHLDQHGATLQTVAGWLRSQRGLRRFAFQVVSWPTRALAAWIAAGGGLRGAVVAVDVAALYPGQRRSAHAVALVWSGLADELDDTLVLIDPWPTMCIERRPPGTLPNAMAMMGNTALMISWCP